MSLSTSTQVPWDTSSIKSPPSPLGQQLILRYYWTYKRNGISTNQRLEYLLIIHFNIINQILFTLYINTERVAVAHSCQSGHEETIPYDTLSNKKVCQFPMSKGNIADWKKRLLWEVEKLLFHPIIYIALLFLSWLWYCDSTSTSI